MELSTKYCRCCGKKSFQRAGPRPILPFFLHFALHLRVAVVADWDALSTLPGVLVDARADVVYGVCTACRLIAPWPEFSDDMLQDYYVYYGTEEYKQGRLQFDRGYAGQAAVHGSPEELVLRREQHEELILPVLSDFCARNGLATLNMLDYGGGTGAVAPKADWIAGYLFDVGDKEIRPIQASGQSEPMPALHTFDFVQLLHVLEHVGHPRRVLQDALSYLEPGGLLYVEVPWEMNDTAAVPNPDTAVLVCDEHLNKFCDHSVRAMVESLGLQVMSCDEGWIQTTHLGDQPTKVVKCLARLR